MIIQNKLHLSASLLVGSPLAMAATAGATIDSELRDRPAQWDHKHWYGLPSASAITAHAGGGQSSATVLASAINHVVTVASAGDSVVLPASAAGAWYVVVNSGANALQLYGKIADTINGAPAATGVSVAVGKTYLVFCPTVGLWFGEAIDGTDKMALLKDVDLSTLQTSGQSLVWDSTTSKWTPTTIVTVTKLAADGLVDDTAALTTALSAASGKMLILPGGTIKITAQISAALSNCKIVGVPGQTKITGAFGYALLRLLDCSNVVFEDITFENTYVNATEDLGYGLVWSQRNTLTNLTFNRCSFTCPSANTNAVKFNASTSADGLTYARFYKDIRFLDCQFYDIGRMGIEILNHYSDTVDRVKSFYIQRSGFKNLGLSGSYGMAVSFSGRQSNLHVQDCDIDNPLGIGIEFAGSYKGYCQGNFFRNVTRATALIATSDSSGGNKPVTDMTISGNKTDGYQSAATVSFGQISSSSIYDNQFNIGGYIDVIDAVDNFFDKNTIISTGIYGMLFRINVGKVNTNNKIERTTIDCSSASSGSFIATVQFDGVGTTQNLVRRCKLKRPGAGNFLGISNTATYCWMEQTDTDSTLWSRAVNIVTLSGAGPTTLSPQTCQYETLEFRGTLSANHTVFCDRGADRLYIVRNATTGGFSVDFRPSSGNLGSLVANGKQATIALRNASLDTVTVGAFASTVSVSTLTDVDLTTPQTSGQSLIWNSSTSKWVPSTVVTSAAVDAAGGDPTARLASRGGPLTSGVWYKLPSIYKIILGGTGSVSFDTKTAAGAITTGVISYTAGTDASVQYFYFGDTAYQVRATLGGTATAEIV